MLFCATGNRGKKIFSQADQSISNAVAQKRDKKTFSHTQSQHAQIPVSGNILQDTSISSNFVTSEHSNFTKCRKVKMFYQKSGKTKRRPHIFRDGERLQYPFYCATRTTESPKSGNNVTRGNRFDKPGGQRNADQGCDFNSKNS